MILFRTVSNGEDHRSHNDRCSWWASNDSKYQNTLARSQTNQGIRATFFWKLIWQGRNE